MEGKGKFPAESELEDDKSNTDNVRDKLKRGMMLVGRIGGPKTPPPTWRLEFSKQDDNVREFLCNTSEVTARKLCANLWEVEAHVEHLRRRKSVGSGKVRLSKDKKAVHLVDPPNTPPLQAASTSALRRHAKTPVVQPRRSIKESTRALQPLSPCLSSPEKVAPRKSAVTPTSSFNFDGRMRESSYSLKTSTELLNVLNRIWTLEEQQKSNVSSLRALKLELDHSKKQTKELLKDREKKRQEMDGFMKQLAEDKFIRKNEEHKRIKAIVGSVQEELEDERKLRRHSESLHRKLARELSEVKSSFSNVIREFERERKARLLLENLCDEFAKGIREYEQEVRSLRHQLDTDHVGKEQPDRLVLHISEAWLDGQMQKKLAKAENDPSEKNTIVGKLCLDIETFLEARRTVDSRRDGSLLTTMAPSTYPRRESFPLNEVASAPQHADDEEESTGGDSGCFELNKSTDRKQTAASSSKQGNALKSTAMIKEGEARGENQVARSSSGGISNNIHETNLRASRRKSTGTLRFYSPNNVLDSLTRNYSLSSEGDRIHPEENLKDGSCTDPVCAGESSSVQQWKSSPIMRPKENTLEAKLLEARLESQRARSKASKV